MRFLFALGILIAIFCAAFLACGVENTPTTSRTTTAIVNTHNPGFSGKLSFLFATNHYVDHVYRINLDTLDVDNVEVGDKPRSIAASPDGKFVVCANEDSTTITLIHSETLTTWWAIVGMKPVELRFSPDGNWLAVANFENHSVALINTYTREVSHIDACSGPTSLDFDDNSEILAVACYHAGTVQLIDVNEKTTLDSDPAEGIEVHNRTQVVLFGREGTNAQNLLFAGFRESPLDEAIVGSNYSIGVIDFEQEPWEPEFVLSAINPRTFFWNHAGDKLISIHHGQDGEDNIIDSLEEAVLGIIFPEATIPGQVSVLAVDENRHVAEEKRYIIGGNPVTAAMDPNRDFIAVADKENSTVVFIDLVQKRQFSIKTEIRPYALGFNSSGTRVIVVHETPLMPVSMIDVANRKSKVIYKSLSMNRWVE
jgi:DNA-binding beta-propeller fold protein YncE